MLDRGGMGDLVVEVMEALGVEELGTSGAEGAGSDVGVVEESDVGVLKGALASAPPQAATVNKRAMAPTRQRAAYERCCPTGTHGSERNRAKWSKLGMMAW
ncbi:MAG: hypothetical protein ABI662_05630 [Dermatophilaceae bacterium]